MRDSPSFSSHLKDDSIRKAGRLCQRYATTKNLYFVNKIVLLFKVAETQGFYSQELEKHSEKEADKSVQRSTRF